MTDDSRSLAALERIVKELTKAREIPSTALRLRELSVEDSVEYVRNDPRFTNSQVTLHNREALLTATDATPAWPGLVAEFGVYGGSSLTALAKVFDDQVVHGFDSFQGLPEKWTGSKQRRGAFDVKGKPPELPVQNVEFHVGWFNATVPEFAARTTEKFRFVHLDADLYTSTRTVFDVLEDRFVPGTVIVFDEYFGYHGWRNHEHKAFLEFLERTGLDYEGLVVGHMNLGVRLLAT